MENTPSPEQPKRSPNAYARYSAMGFQMAAIIGLGVYGGIELDKRFRPGQFPLFSVSLSLLSVCAAVWYAVKDIIMNKKK